MFEAGADECRGRGGARQNAGRKPALATVLKQLAISDAHGEAEKSLQFCVEVRDCQKARTADRLAAAEIVMNRVWGRPGVAESHKNQMRRIVFNLPEEMAHNEKDRAFVKDFNNATGGGASDAESDN